MRITIFQCESLPGEPERRIESLAAAAAACSGDVIICPELFACGYSIGAETAQRLAEPANGVFARAARDIAREHRIALVYGYAERAGDAIHNSALCIDRRGEVVANHRKLYLSGSYEERTFVTGSEHTVFDLDGVRTGLLICFDVEFPESVRALRRAGCELVLVPTALAARWQHLTRTLVPTRAFENGLFLAYANYCGVENGIRYCGNSLVAGPDGFERARAGDAPTLLDADVDLADNLDARAALPYLEKLDAAAAARP